GAEQDPGACQRLQDDRAQPPQFGARRCPDRPAARHRRRAPLGTRRRPAAEEPVSAGVAGAEERRTQSPPIGGVFELDLAAVLEAQDAPARFPEAQSVTSGRTALAILAEEVPGPWLLPAYLCDSVVQPLRPAARSATPSSRASASTCRSRTAAC